MRGARSPLAAALAALAALSAAAAADNCSAVRRAGSRAETARVVLLWHEPAAGAAAALLRAALLAAGRAPGRVLLRRARAAADLCALLAAPRADLLPCGRSPRAACAAEWADSVPVAVAVPWSAACAWRPNRLRVLGAGAAPLAPRLHARLTPAAAQAGCAARALLLRAADAAALRDCEFLPPLSSSSSADAGDVPVYVPRGEWAAASAALPPPLRAAAVPRAELARMLLSAERSFLFLDAALWSDEPRALPLPLPAEPRPDPVSVLVADEDEMLRHAPALFELLSHEFAPAAADVRAVLELAAPDARDEHDEHDERGLEQAACARAPSTARFAAWRVAAGKFRRRRAVAVLCADDDRSGVYENAVQRTVAEYVNEEIERRAPGAGAGFTVAAERVDCADPAAFAGRILEWRCSGDSWLTVGVAAPAAVAAVAAPYAAAERLPLLAYTPTAAGVRAATGRAERLARALRRVFAACRWRRVGLVADESALATGVRGALRALGAAATLRAATEREPAAAVRELLALDARIFLVLGSATTVARALRAARELRLTPDRYVWIVCEYATPVRNASAATAATTTAALAPVSVSFEWRGGPEGGKLRAALDAQAGAALEAGPWPRALAPLVDAVLTLAAGHARLVERHNGTLEYHDDPDKLRDFWEGVRSSKVAGLVGDLEYDERGVVAAPVYVERWYSAHAPPSRLATWRERDLDAAAACPLQDPPPDGGPRRCLTLAGAPFQERCLDGAWAGALAAAALLAATAAGARRWLAHRDRRLRRAVTVRVLARREAAFADLAPHLVERAALRLGAELGAGRFGRVWLAELSAPRRRRPAVLAAKAPREGASPAEEGELLREARTLASLRHEHVVRFEGVCWDGGPPLLLMEHAFFGDLLRYLRERRHLAGEGGGEGGEAAHVSAAALTRLAREAAEALAHLAARGLVHRDVRAANCLVDARRSLKLADFGLARALGAPDGEYACRGRALFPVLWMAPESLARGVATPASDAWSFGVLALELVTLGARPFGEAAPARVVRAVLGGGRAPLPRDASAETRALALACWRRAPERRPTAARLARWLARRPAALRPALQPHALELDCDSGIGAGEPELASWGRGGTRLSHLAV